MAIKTIAKSDKAGLQRIAEAILKHKRKKSLNKFKIPMIWAKRKK
mgnify:CR=1 FL=1